MTKTENFLNDKLWSKLKDLLPQPKPSPKGGRPRIDNRKALEGILWVLRTGARWKDLPKQYPSYPTCWRRLREWEEEGIWLKVWRTYLGELDAKGILDWEESFMDGSFAPAKKEAIKSEKPRRGKAQNGWWWPMAKAFLWEASSPRHRSRK